MRLPSKLSSPLSHLHARSCRRGGKAWAVVVAIVVAAFVSSGRSHAATEPVLRQFGDLAITVQGAGRPVLLIPGLNSASEVWQETCTQLQPGVQCHRVQLPGFAGQAPASHAHWLAALRDQLLSYADTLVAADGARVPVVGHSLGGVLGLMMAAERDVAIDRVVVVDALPFLPAVQNPAATVASVTPMAQSLRDGMLQATPEQTAARALPMLRTMVHGADRVATLERWGELSDRATSAQAFYEVMTTDLRPLLPRIQRPVLVLGAWAAYAGRGATLEGVRAAYGQQYQGLAGVAVEMSRAGYHFLMWDDPEWLHAQLRGFLARGRL